MSNLEYMERGNAMFEMGMPSLSVATQYRKKDREGRISRAEGEIAGKGSV